MAITFETIEIYVVFVVGILLGVFAGWRLNVGEIEWFKKELATITRLYQELLNNEKGDN